MKIAIIINFGFPRGMASTNRARHLGLGLTENNCQVEVIVPKPTEFSDRAINHDLAGVTEGINYRYTTSSTIIPKNNIVCRYRVIKGFISCARSVYKNRQTIDAVVLYLRSISAVAFLGLWCKLLGIPVILELCEWSVSHRNTGLKTKIQNWLITTPLFVFVDGVIAISSFLEKRVIEFSIRHKLRRLCLVVPILVKSDNYQCSGAYNPRGDLLFSGILDQTDIVLFLLDVVSEMRKAGHARKLTILGKAFIKENLELIHRRIAALGLQDLVELAGYLPEDELKRSYCTAAVLLAPLPSGDRSIARFPNKIGEYLASGRPVITTGIGDIPNYLTDGESACLVKPDDVTGFAAAIIKVLNDPEKAEKMGKEGAGVAVKCFDPKINGKKIIDLISNLRTNTEPR